MCKKKNLVFREISKNEKVDPNSICVFGWNREKSFEQKLNDNVEYGFWTMALAYYQSAEILYENFLLSKGNYSVLDSTGTTMCFLYRHYVELSLKYLYLKYSCPSEKEYEIFLKNNHDLNKLWKETKPLLRTNKNHYQCLLDIGVVENYIRDITRFDKDSMTMRYPITKKLTQMKERTRLDIPNLHDRMNELHEAFDAFDYDFPKNDMLDLPLEEIESFLEKYLEMKPKIELFLNSIESETRNKSNRSSCQKIVEMFLAPHPTPFDALSDDELILLDTLYYTGSLIHCHNLLLPRNPQEAKNVAVKQCILNMKRDELEFGKPLNDNIGVKNKNGFLIIENVYRALSVIEYDSQFKDSFVNKTKKKK